MNRARARALLTTLVFLSGLALWACEAPPRFGFDFETETELDTLHWKCGTFFSRTEHHATSGRFSLRADLYPSPPGAEEDYPGLRFSDFDPDWSGARTLAADVFVPGSDPVRLVVRIDDRDDPPYDDRYNRAVALPPGQNALRIPLKTLETSGTRRLLDRRRIQAVYFFLVRPAHKRTLFFDTVRLRP